MHRYLLAISLLLAFSVALAAQADNKDTSVINGTYKTTKAINDGNEVLINGMFVPVKMWFENGKFKMWTEQNDFEGTYTVDNEKDPMWITIAYDGYTNKPYQGTSFRGLYSLEDDVLTIVTNVQRRPTSLDAKKFSLDFKLILKRLDEEDSKSKDTQR